MQSCVFSQIDRYHIDNFVKKEGFLGILIFLINFRFKTFKSLDIGRCLDSTLNIHLTIQTDYLCI